VSGPAPDEERIAAVIAGHLADHLDPRPAGPITAGTRLLEDLALDSAQSLELIAALEDHYRVALSIDLLEDVRTVGDVARVVAAALAGRGEGEVG
jgi:acyl carrier protein